MIAAEALRIVQSRTVSVVIHLFQWIPLQRLQNFEWMQRSEIRMWLSFVPPKLLAVRVKGGEARGIRRVP